MKVLVVEDDRPTRDFIERGLAAHGMSVEGAASLGEAIPLTARASFDAIVLDVMLPDGDGFELLRRLREQGVATPVVFVSALGEVTDRLRGFELGGDDYLRKPFALAELVARVRIVGRRRDAGAAGNVLGVGDLTLDFGRRIATRGDRPIELTARQFDLLAYLMRNRGLVVSRSMLVEAVWGHGFETRSNAVEVQIMNLRDRIDRDWPVKLLHTVRGVGYVLEPRGGDEAQASDG